MKKVKPKSKNEGISKIQKIRNMFAERDSWTVSELVKKSGHDEPNVRTTMSILKNPKRSKEPLITNYDKEKKIYSIK